MNREEIEEIEENLENIDFHTRQERAMSAMKDSCFGDDRFVFPIVDGPPGTGKTFTATAGIASYLVEEPQEQFAYLCPTHYAAQKAKENFERLGFPPDRVVRLAPNFYETNETQGIIGCKNDLSNLSRNQVRMLKNCEVVLSTLHGAKRVLNTRSKSFRFIVDEFSQVDPSLFFSAIGKTKHQNRNPNAYALFGDPEQLPVVTTQPRLRMNIADYIVSRQPSYDPHRLEIQHRMHEDICQAVNTLRRCFNAPPIDPHPEVRNRGLVEMGYRWEESQVEGNFREILDPEYPFVIVNTDACGEEDRNTFGKSVRNTGEAKLAAKISELFHETFVDESGEQLTPEVLSPYTAQVGEIKNLISGSIAECITIYKAQGREYPCVILSFVRNNSSGNIGFLKAAETRAQSYVGCSRAQAKLVLLFSRETFLTSGTEDYELLYETDSAHIVEAPDEGF